MTLVDLSLTIAFATYYISAINNPTFWEWTFLNYWLAEHNMWKENVERSINVVFPKTRFPTFSKILFFICWGMRKIKGNHYRQAYTGTALPSKLLLSLVLVSKSKLSNRVWRRSKNFTAVKAGQALSAVVVIAKILKHITLK